MAKDRNKLVHMHSSVSGKQPTPESLLVGELAINNSKGNEFISLKNSEDKVIRFSSDSSMINWIEKKEVFPYSGVVDNIDLNNNRSNIEIKLNQFVAANSPYYGNVNDAVDIDGDPVNPSVDGKTNGAGIAIDTSMFVLNGGNPNFKRISVSHESNLSGVTNIVAGEEGSELNVNVSEVHENAGTIEVAASQSMVQSAPLMTVSGTTTKIIGVDELSLSGDTNIYGDAVVDGTVTAKSGLTVNIGGANVVGNSVVDGTLEVKSGLTVDTGGFNVTGNSAIDGTLTTKNATADGTVTAKSGLTVNTGGFNVTGNSAIDGTLTTKNATADGTITAKSGLTVNTGGAKITGNSSIDGTLSAKNTTIDGTLTSNNALTVNAGGFNVTGNSTIDGTLTTKNATADGTVTAKSGLTVNTGGFNVTGNSAIDGTLITKNATADGTVTAKSGLTVNTGGAKITGNSTIDGTLTTKNATADGTVTAKSGLTVNTGGAKITGNSSVSGNLEVTGTLTLPSGLSTSLNWTYGDVHNEPSGTGKYNAGSASDTAFTVPKSVTHLTEWNATSSQLNIPGSISAISAIYSSDINLKENINNITDEEINKVKTLDFKSFNFKDDETKRKMYGVIAQHAEALGLGHLVHMADDGTKGVDYTSLFVLKLAAMAEEIKALKKEIDELKKN